MFKKKIYTNQDNHLTLEISAKCNLYCSMCSLEKHHHNKGFMSKNTFNKILPYIKQFNIVDFGFTGEPFLNKNLIYFLKKIKKINPNIYLQIITNGTLLSDKIMKDLIKFGLDEIMFSIDGASKQIYEHIRIGSDFNKVINNIKKLNSFKKKYSSNKPIFTSTFVIMEQNYLEMLKFVELMKKLDFKRIMFNNVEPYSLKSYNDSFYDKKSKEIKKNLQDIKNSSKKSDLEIIIPRFKSKRHKFCSYMYPLLAWNGDIIPCGTLSYDRPFFSFGKKDFYYEKSFGNIHEQNFNKIWNLKEYSDFRNNLAKGIFNKECENCLRSFGIICGNKLL